MSGESDKSPKVLPANQALAGDFLKAFAGYYASSGVPGSLTRVLRAIKAVPVSIPEYRREHGGLAGLEIPGTADRVKAQLELILEHGADEAEKIVREGQADTWREQGMNIRKSPHYFKTGKYETW